MNTKQPLKFRVWTGKEFVHNLTINPDGAYQYWTLEGMKSVGISSIQQATGLKDKDGREIYDGDIIKSRIRDKVSESPSKFEFVLTVYWDNYYSQWWAKDKDVAPHLCRRFPFEGSHYEIRRDRTTIVGNIIENPERLKNEY